MAHHPSMSKTRVLVVDDYPGARYRRMRLLLDDGRYEVMEEALGREAVRRTREEQPDLVLLDLHLPDISGVDVCRAIKADPLTADIPVVLISAVSEREEAMDLARRCGAVSFVPDAADAHAFLAAIESACAPPRT